MLVQRSRGHRAATECARGFVFCGCCVTGSAPTHAEEQFLHVGRPLGVRPIQF
jgi:hypothetical protein